MPGFWNGFWSFVPDENRRFLPRSWIMLYIADEADVYCFQDDGTFASYL